MFTGHDPCSRGSTWISPEKLTGLKRVQRVEAEMEDKSRTNMHVKEELLAGLNDCQSITAKYGNWSLFKHILGNSEVTVESSSRSRPYVYVSDGGGAQKNTQPASFRTNLPSSVSFWAWVVGGGWIHVFTEFKMNVENTLVLRSAAVLQGGSKEPSLHTSRHVPRLEELGGGLGDVGFDLYW